MSLTQSEGNGNMLKNSPFADSSKKLIYKEMKKSNHYIQLDTHKMSGFFVDAVDCLFSTT